MPLRVGIVVVNLGVFAWFLLTVRHGAVSWYVYRADLNVYRLGAEMWLNGGDLYGVLHSRTSSLFTYPPISAVLFTPFAAVSFGVASAALSVLTIGLLVPVLVVMLRSLDVRPSWVLVGMLLPVALVIEPVRSTLHYGQVNVALMALVTLDCLVRTPRWPRGMLVGVAAAVKLTPAVFVLFFLLRGDRRAALVAGMSFAGSTGLGFLLAPRDSVTYWTAAVFDTERVGGAARATNQSIKGILARFGIESSVLWLVLSAALLAAAAVAMRQAFAAGQHTLALCLNAFGALPVTPISWCHHWVWIVPGLVTLGVIAWRTRATLPIALTAGGLVLFILSPHWWSDPSRDGVARMVTGSLYTCFAVLVVAAGARLADRELGRARVDVDHRAVA